MGRKRTKRSIDKSILNLWSKIIRNRDKVCQKCKVKPAQEAHHIFGKRNMYTRYDLENGIGLCHMCHVFDAQGFEQNGSSFDNLQVIWNKVGKVKWKRLSKKSKEDKIWPIEELLEKEKELKEKLL